MLGGGPSDEDPPLDDVDPNIFYFFSYGQACNRELPNNDHGAPVDNQDGNGGAPQWGLWPDGLDAQGDDVFIGPLLPDGPIPDEAEENVGPNGQPVPTSGEEPNSLAKARNGLNIDLNMAIEEDLGGIENLIQAAENLEAEQEHPVDEEDIIDGTGSSDDSMINAPAPNLAQENVHVEVFIPQDYG